MNARATPEPTISRRNLRSIARRVKKISISSSKVTAEAALCLE